MLLTGASISSVIASLRRTPPEPVKKSKRVRPPEVEPAVVKQTHVRIDHAYELYNTATRELLCTAESTIACINKKGEVQAIPEFLGGKYAG